MSTQVMQGDHSQKPLPIKVKYKNKEHTIMAHTTTGEFYILDDGRGGLLTVKAKECEVTEQRVYVRDF